MYRSFRKRGLEFWFVFFYVCLFGVARLICFRIGAIFTLVEVYLLFTFSKGFYNNIYENKGIGVVASLKLSRKDLFLFLGFLRVLIAVVILYFLLLSPMLLIVFLYDLSIVSSLENNKLLVKVTEFFSIFASGLFQLVLAYTLSLSIQRNKADFALSKEAILTIFRWKVFTVVALLYTGFLFYLDEQGFRMKMIELAGFLRYSLIPIAVLYYFYRIRGQS